MFERPQTGECAILVNIGFPFADQNEDPGEFKELATSAGAIPVATITGTRKYPNPKYFVGSGKAEEIRLAVKEHQADLVLFNHVLTPIQERELERLFECRVLDRTGLILDIFAQRARSFEGKLQVELAQLRHISTRLVRGWTHLERQKGGIGLRGPGETQLETDRRLIGQRIKQLKKRLDKVHRQRDLGRKSRRKAAAKTVSLVGYTNAGKSTLFNRLTGADCFIADQLFATLDSTLRKFELPIAQDVVLADTVGFIRNLPHDLVAAFRSTLEETREADLLLHVVDVNNENHHACIEQVNQVLKEIGAENIEQIVVYNKIDLNQGNLNQGNFQGGIKPPVARVARVDRNAKNRIERVWLSAQTGDGLDLLKNAVAERLYYQINGYRSSGELKHEHQASGYRANNPQNYGSNNKGVDGVFGVENPGRQKQRLRLDPGAGSLRARLFDRGVVIDETVNNAGEWLIDVEMWPQEIEDFCRNDGCQRDETSPNEPLSLV